MINKKAIGLKGREKNLDEKGFGLASIMKSVGCPITSEGFVIFYFEDEWKWQDGTFMLPCEESPNDLECALGILESCANKGITKENTSHIIRIFDFYGGPNQLEELGKKYTLESLLKEGKAKVLIINKSLFEKYVEGED